MSKKLIVIGGGAAGFFCALTAARKDPQLQVTILEKSNKLLSKVRVSGGGRCNVTHSCFEIEQMIRKYPRGANLLKKAFHQFFTTDTIKWFEARGVQLKTEEDGRMFPITNSSQTIINCLMQEANQLGIEIVMNAEVQRIVATVDNFQISLSNNRAVGIATAGEGNGELSANFICVATGGYPKATMFDWLSETGH